MPDIPFRVTVDTSELERARREATQVQRALLQAGDTGSARSLIEARFGRVDRVPRQLRQELSRLEEQLNQVAAAADRALKLGGSRIQASRLNIDPKFIEAVAGTTKPLFGQLNLEQTASLLELLASEAGRVSREIETWQSSASAFEPVVATLQDRLSELRAAFNRVADARERALSLGGGRIQASQLGIPPDILERVVGTAKPQFGQIDLQQALEVMRELEKEGLDVSNEISKWADGLRQVTQELAIQVTRTGEVRNAVREIAEGLNRQQAERAASDQGLNTVVNERINKLEEQRLRLIERRAALEEGILGAVGGKTAIDIQKQLVSLRGQEATAVRRVNSILQTRSRIEDDLNRSGQRSVRLFLEQAEAARQAGSQVATPDLRRGAFSTATAEDRQNLEQFIRLTNDLVEAQSKLANIRKQLAQPTEQFENVARLTGTLENFRGVNQELSAIDEQIAKLVGPQRAQEIQLIAPGLLERMVRLRQVLQDIQTIREGGVLTRTSRTGETIIPDQARAFQNLERQRDQLVRNIERQQERLRDVSLLPSVDETIAQLPVLERTLINAFRGFGRRFQATLQFAISGALLFSLQQFAQRAFETAVEVERAFADIATALEFDIEAGRGTADFEQSLERIRIGILQIADEFNVLPTQANEIAFAMVSRFREVDNALEATRAQLLALKVSTIDAQEIIRALTATSEAFAAQVFETNDALSLQERLLRRESAAAKIQTQAMDLATQIQQEWGVQLEDTIEGTARSAEVFRQLGFGLEETAAIVAATSFQLGQTGTNVAERLNRSIGQITSPQIRDQLLDLAAASKEFTLTFADFQTGATALEALSSQFERLQALEPDTARQIAQIVGQRREIEVVSAVLGSRDFQNQIIDSADEAVGAAERRFGFLEDTVSEILASIGSQFEELAQNLERLGALSPFKLLLSSADQFLNIINEILKAVNSLLNGIREIPLIGGFIATAIPNVIALSAALGTVLRTLQAIAKVEAVRVAGGFLSSALGRGRGQIPGQGSLLGGGEAVQVVSLLNLAFVGAKNAITQFGKIAESAGKGFFKAFDAVKNFRIATVQNTISTIAETRARIGLTSALTAQQAAAVTFFGSLTKIALVLGGLAFIVTKLFDSMEAAEKVQETYKDTLAELERDTRQRVALGQIDEREETSERLRNEVRAWEVAAEDAADVWSTAVTNVVESLTNVLFRPDRLASDLTDEDVKARLEFFGVDVEGRQGREDFGKGRRRDEDFFPRDDQITGFWNRFFALAFPTEARRSTIPGSEEEIRFQQGQAVRAVLQDQIANFQQEIFDLDLTDIGPEGRAAGEFFGRRLAQVRQQVESARTEEEIAAAEDAVEALQADYDRFLIVLGVNAEQLELTLNQARRRIEQITTDLEFGRTDPGTAAAEFDKIRDQALRQVEILEKLGLTEEAEDFRALAEDALRSQSQAITQQTTERIALLDLFASEEQRLIGSIEAYAAEVERQRAAGDFAALQRAQQNLIRAEQELSQFYFDRLQEEARFREQLANSIEARRDILQELAKELLQSAVETLVGAFAGINPADRKFFDFSGELERFREALRIIQGIEKEGADLEEEIAIRRTVVDVLSSGPPLDDLTKLQAELARLRQVRAGQEGIAAAETTLEINRVIAEIQQELLRRAAAATLLLAGVNDGIRSLQAQITINSKELGLAAQLYGRQSAQYLELKLAQERLKNELANAQLELRDLGRRLDSDVTNSFQQAQLDLVAVLEKLAAPDLGELERARLELERKNAEAAAERSFFDDRLFQLRFAFETGDIGTGAYVGALQRLLEEVDTSTQQGKEIFLQIQGIIDGLTDDISDLAFNVPTNIRLPTIFEIRRSLAADQLGVNYVDNRQQSINLEITDQLTLEQVLDALDSRISSGASRVPAGAAGITIGAF